MKRTVDQRKDIVKQTGTFESFDGTLIYYEVRGEGRPVFLCYGIACLINHWTHQIKYFSQQYQTITLDYRGHHATPAPVDRDNLSIEAICKDIKGLADHLNIKQASFWGHSYGVQLLLRYYEMYPESVSNLVFINGFASNPIEGMFGVDTISKAFHMFKEGYKSYPDITKLVWRGAISGPWAIPLSALAGGFNLRLTSLKDIEVYARGVATMDLNVFIKLFEEMMDYNGEPVLDKIECAVLIISGNKDGVTPLSYQYKMHERIKNSQLLRVPYGSHCTQLDLPEFVNLKIEKFLTQEGY